MNDPAQPLAYQARLMTYEEAGRRIPTNNGKGRSAEWIARKIKEGKLIGTALGWRTKRVSELNFLKFLAASETIEHRINPSR